MEVGGAEDSDKEEPEEDSGRDGDFKENSEEVSLPRLKEELGPMPVSPTTLLKGRTANRITKKNSNKTSEVASFARSQIRFRRSVEPTAMKARFDVSLAVNRPFSGTLRWPTSLAGHTCASYW